MDGKIFVITKIEGEYAYLANEHDRTAEEIFIAMALLPQGCDVGSRLSYENFEFSLL